MTRGQLAGLEADWRRARLIEQLALTQAANPKETDEQQQHPEARRPDRERRPGRSRSGSGGGPDRAPHSAGLSQDGG